jgi:hypothetical protein
MEMYNLLADDNRLESTRINVITSRLSGAAATWHAQFTGRRTYTTLKSLIKGLEKRFVSVLTPDENRKQFDKWRLNSGETVPDRFQ